MNRSKIILAAISVVFLALVAAFGVMAQGKYAKAAKAKKAAAAAQETTEE